MAEERSGEREPLIKKDESASTSSYSSTYLNDGETGSVAISLAKRRGENPPEKEVAFSTRMIYSWSEINVITQKKLNRRTTRLFSSAGGGNGSRSQGKQLLKNVNGMAYPGEVLAILGSSGAGKTTLLNTLTFRSPTNVRVSGLRCVNGIPVNSASFTRQSAYVQQDDLFIGSLTVKEHLVFQALVRMDRHIPYQQRMNRVEEVISELGLKTCENTLIGIPGRIKGISGGEMKRVSFAAEVLTNPSLMFCDEPTSGLDSFMALNVIQVLKGLAQKGKTMICTIHQPSSELYSMFDKLLLLAEGRVAFLGTPDEADTFFRELEAPCPHNYNPADYFIQLLAVVPGREQSCKQSIDMICNRFDRSELGVKLAVDASTLTRTEYNYDELLQNGKHKNPYKASWCAQFRAVLWRSWLSVMKEPLLIKVRILQTCITSLIVGMIYFGQKLNQEGVMNINGALFIFLTSMTFQNVFAVINVFCSELPLFLREHKNGMYRTDVYFLCKTLAELPLFTFIPVLFTSICYFLIGLNHEDAKFFIAIGIVVLVANVATSFGYLISCISKSVSMAFSIGPPLIIPFLLFGGFFLNVKSVPTYFEWLGYASWFRYGNEALLINQWSGVENIDCSMSLNKTCPKSGDIVLKVYNFSEADFAFDFIALAVLIVGFRFLAYFALLMKTY